jgi:predicted restriction endonuclease
MRQSATDKTDEFQRKLIEFWTNNGIDWKSDHPEQPFWRLQRDGVWTVHAPAGLALKTGDVIPRVTALRSHDVRAGFSADVQTALAADLSLAAALASRILEQHFPESLHQDILNAVVLTPERAITRRKRDPAFRQRVLKAYEYRCAVCGFDVRLGSVPIALDAAHIRCHHQTTVATANTLLVSSQQDHIRALDRPKIDGSWESGYAYLRPRDAAGAANAALVVSLGRWNRISV